MIDVDAGGTDARARRRTWMLGGGLLAASALLSLWAASVPGIPVGFIPDLFFAAGAVILAVGLGLPGSVTARRRLGTGTIIALAAWTLLQPMIQDLLLPADPMADMTDWGNRAWLIETVSLTLEAVSLALALLAVAQIGRAGVVPRPWNWAPLWALGVVVAVRVVSLLVMMVPGITDTPDVAVAVSSLAWFLMIGATGFLGVLAMVLAARPVPGTTPVYGSGE